jgi:hypothetical protein
MSSLLFPFQNYCSLNIFFANFLINFNLNFPLKLPHKQLITLKRQQRLSNFAITEAPIYILYHKAFNFLSFSQLHFTFIWFQQISTLLLCMYLYIHTYLQYFISFSCFSVSHPLACSLSADPEKSRIIGS